MVYLEGVWSIISTTIWCPNRTQSKFKNSRLPSHFVTMSSLYILFLIVCLLLGIRGTHSLSDFGNDRKLLKRGRGDVLLLESVKEAICRMQKPRWIPMWLRTCFSHTLRKSQNCNPLHPLLINKVLSTAISLQVLKQERLDCERICKGQAIGECKSSCDTVFCVAKYGDYCASKLNRTQVNSIRRMDCEYSTVSLSNPLKKCPHWPALLESSYPSL